MGPGQPVQAAGLKEYQGTREVADLFYHALVLLAATGASPKAVWRELRQRRKV